MSTTTTTTTVTKSKLELYKTAYSSLYDAYVSIIRVRYDDNGEPIIHAKVKGVYNEILFREHELKNFCL